MMMITKIITKIIIMMTMILVITIVIAIVAIVIIAIVGYLPSTTTCTSPYITPRSLQSSVMDLLVKPRCMPWALVHSCCNLQGME